MNKTKIEWTDRTWNPITGCLHGCWYCYAYKMFQRFHRSFEPTFHPERLNDPELNKESMKIFVCSVADLFADWTSKDWVRKVLNTMEQHPQHKYQLLTKQPHLIDTEYDLHNYWVGATINDQSEVKKIYDLLNVNAKIRFASFEPLLGEIKDIPEDLDWIIVGKLTGSKKVPLKSEWVENIIRHAREFDIPIFIKDNVHWKDKIQEFPI